MIICLACGHKPPLCAQCRAHVVGCHAGPACSRGQRWAEKVVRRARDPLPPWPDTPRALAIAARWVRDLGGDELVDRELARLCWGAARDRYERLRADPAAVRDLRAQRDRDGRW